MVIFSVFGIYPAAVTLNWSDCGRLNATFSHRILIPGALARAFLKSVRKDLQIAGLDPTALVLEGRCVEAVG